MNDVPSLIEDLDRQLKGCSWTDHLWDSSYRGTTVNWYLPKMTSEDWCKLLKLWSNRDEHWQFRLVSILTEADGREPMVLLAKMAVTSIYRSVRTEASYAIEGLEK